MKCSTSMVRYVLAASISAVAHTAAGAAANGTALELTVGEYLYAGYHGNDVSLAWRAEDTSASVGFYTDRRYGTQSRAGVDTAVKLGKYLELQPSVQVASKGFVGGSVTTLAGGSWYAIAGFGRTDARPYFSLNFDPNDALTLGAGHRDEDGVSYMVFLIADDRFHSGQRDWHVNAQIPSGDSHATLDVMRKSGLSDAGRIAGWGFSANWDWPTRFIRVAYDPYQNFSAEKAWRFAVGIRF